MLEVPAKLATFLEVYPVPDWGKFGAPSSFTIVVESIVKEVGGVAVDTSVNLLVVSLKVMVMFSSAVTNWSLKASITL